MGKRVTKKSKNTVKGNYFSLKPIKNNAIIKSKCM